MLYFRFSDIGIHFCYGFNYYGYFSELSYSFPIRKRLSQKMMKNSVLPRKSAALNGFMIFVLSVCSHSLKADEPLLPPQKVIQEIAAVLQKRLLDEDFKSDVLKAREFVLSVVEPHLDFNRFSAYVLGKHWKRASRDQKNRFKKEFKTLLVRTYTTAFSEYADSEIRFSRLDLKPGDKKIIVKTEILQSGAAPVSISYRMVDKKGAWKVYDVIIEGISLVTNYRSSIKNEIARTGSLDTVIEHLAARNSELANSEDTAEAIDTADAMDTANDGS